jgi:pantoate--beta-alanine ligase
VPKCLLPGPLVGGSDLSPPWAACMPATPAWWKGRWPTATKSLSRFMLIRHSSAPTKTSTAILATLPVFAPDTAEMYPPGNATRIEVSGPAEPFEGRLRPGHFSGVATIVCRLFQAIPADAAYFGAKDWQQTLVIKQMVRDLGLPIEIRVCPTVREPDGLAMSSRNAYLTSEQRQQARALSRVLEQAHVDWQAGAAVATITDGMTTALDAAGIAIDYAAVVAAETLRPLESQPPETAAIALVAGHLGQTRLIDNLPLSPRGSATC